MTDDPQTPQPDVSLSDPVIAAGIRPARVVALAMTIGVSFLSIGALIGREIAPLSMEFQAFRNADHVPQLLAFGICMVAALLGLAPLHRLPGALADDVAAATGKRLAAYTSRTLMRYSLLEGAGLIGLTLYYLFGGIWPIAGLALVLFVMLRQLPTTSGVRVWLTGEPAGNRVPDA